ncbi:hypothetical protein ACFYL6_20795 [Micromonospora sp. NPDC007208]|uniref:hypothetical protein n=1 Tax=Micromonospora sp. NPDC007208 TaxID=3364236 RepID=UPI0036C2EAFC
MTNPNKTKGSGAERAVIEHLRATGWPHAERRLAGASKDRGDIAGVPGVVIEVKNCTRTELAAWLAEAEQERINDHADLAAVWHKRRGKSAAADWFVTMDGATFTRLLAAAGYGSGRDQPVIVPHSAWVDDDEPAPLVAPYQGGRHTGTHTIDLLGQEAS